MQIKTIFFNRFILLVSIYLAIIPTISSHLSTKRKEKLTKSNQKCNLFEKHLEVRSFRRNFAAGIKIIFI